MVLLSWYSRSASGFFGWLGRIFERSYHLLEKLGIGPNVLFISIICGLLVIWMFMMRKYDSQAKDKGLID